MQADCTQLVIDKKFLEKKVKSLEERIAHKENENNELNLKLKSYNEFDQEFQEIKKENNNLKMII